MGDFDPRLVLAVLASPSRAFARLGGGDYLAQAAWVLAVASAAGVLPLLAFSSVPLESKFGVPAGELGLPSGPAGVAEHVVYGIAAGLLSAALVYLVGRAAGGRGGWRRVFVMALHAHAPAAVASLVLAGPALLVAGEIASLDPVLLEDAGDSEAADALAPLAGYLLLVLVVGVASLAWVLAVSVKAVKAAHGLGTLASLAIVVIAKMSSALILAAPAYAGA